MTPAERAAGILRSIEAMPEAFDMNSWFYAPDDGDVLLASEEVDPHCGTTMCVAGWACHNAGYDLFEVEIGEIIASRPGDSLSGGHIQDVAADLLGISRQQADCLFHTTNSMARRAIRWLARGASWPPNMAFADFALYGANGGPLHTFNPARGASE